MTLTIDACVWLAALSPAEPDHAACADLLHMAVAEGLALHQPTLFVIEVCATIARRTRDPALAASVGDTIVATPGLTLHPLDHAGSAHAAEVAMTCALRGADAIYVATARALQATLISLDHEVLDRAASSTAVMSPDAWLASRRARR